MAQAINAAGLPPAEAVQEEPEAIRRLEAAHRDGVGPTARWFILFLLAIGVLISFVDRSSVGAAIADKQFVREFNLSHVSEGWLSSAFFWSYGVTQLFMGWLVDRYGVKWPYLIFFAMWCVVSVVTSMIGSLSILVIARLLVGVAEAIVVPASYRWIRNHFEEGQNGFAVGIFAMGNKFGPALGTPAALWLIANYSWRAVFVAMAAVGVLWLIAFFVLVPSDLPPSSQREQVRKQASAVSFGAALRSPVVWGGMLTNFCYGYFTFYCMTWMPKYLVDQRGLSLSKSGLYTFFSFAGIAIVAVVTGWLADRIIARGHNAVTVRKIFVTIGFLGGCTVLLGAKSDSLDAALFWNVVSLSLLGFATANNLALCRLTLIPKPAVGMVTGIQQVATALSGGISAGMSGWLLKVSGGYDLPMQVIFVFLVIGAVGTWVLLRPEWAPKVAEPTPAA